MAWTAPVIHSVGDVLTASDWNISSNDLTYLRARTLGQTSTTSSTANTTTSVTWLTQAFTADGVQRVRISGCGWVSGTAIGDLVALNLVLDGTTVQVGQAYIAAAGGSGQVSLTPWCELVPSSGSHTATLVISTGSGTVTGVAGATHPAYLLIEDIGT